MTLRFYDALMQALEATGTTLAEACRASGVSYEQMKKFIQRASKDSHTSTNVDDAVKLAHSFWMTLDEFLQDDTARRRDEALRLWLQLTSAERSILQAAARGRAD